MGDRNWDSRFSNLLRLAAFPAHQALAFLMSKKPVTRPVDGLPERVGTVFGFAIMVGVYAMIIWPIVRAMLYQ